MFENVEYPAGSSKLLTDFKYSDAFSLLLSRAAGCVSMLLLDIEVDDSKQGVNWVKLLDASFIRRRSYFAFSASEIIVIFLFLTAGWQAVGFGSDFDVEADEYVSLKSIRFVGSSEPSKIDLSWDKVGLAEVE